MYQLCDVVLSSVTSDRPKYLGVYLNHDLSGRITLIRWQPRHHGSWLSSGGILEVRSWQRYISSLRNGILGPIWDPYTKRDSDKLEKG